MELIRVVLLCLYVQMSLGQKNDVNKGNCQCCESHLCPDETESVRESKETQEGELKVGANENKATLEENFCTRTSEREWNADSKNRLSFDEEVKQSKAKLKESSPGNKATKSNSNHIDKNSLPKPNIFNGESSTTKDGVNVHFEAGNNEQLTEHASDSNANNADGQTYKANGDEGTDNHSTFNELLNKTKRLIIMLRVAESTAYEYLECDNARSIYCIEVITQKTSSVLMYCVDMICFCVGILFTYVMYVIKYVIMAFLFILANIFWVLIWLSAFLFMVVLTYPLTVISTLFDFLVSFVIYPTIEVVVLVVSVIFFILILLILYNCLFQYLENRKINNLIVKMNAENRRNEQSYRYNERRKQNK